MPAEIAEGQLLGDRYRIGRFIGRGATSEVHVAMDLRLDRPVAVKFLRADLAADPGSRRRFATEARTAARLCHPHVVAVYDTATPEPPGRPYIVMELLGGPTLREVLAAGPMPEASARDMAVQVLSALDAAARIGLAHCDIKPDNIVATGDGRWKVADFGTAGHPSDGETASGTPAYLAPERVLGFPATAASDVFSLGVVLYEAVTGRRPYETLDAHPWTSAVGGLSPVPLEELRPGMDPRFTSAVDRAVESDPARRFALPADMSAALGSPLIGLAEALSAWTARPPLAAPVVPEAGGPDTTGPDTTGPDTMAVRVIGGRMAVPARTLATLRLAAGSGAALAVALTVALTLPGGSARPAPVGPTAPAAASAPTTVTRPARADGPALASASPAPAPTVPAPATTSPPALVSAVTPDPAAAPAPLAPAVTAPVAAAPVTSTPASKTHRAVGHSHRPSAHAGRGRALRPGPAGAQPGPAGSAAASVAALGGPGQPPAHAGY